MKTRYLVVAYVGLLVGAIQGDLMNFNIHGIVFSDLSWPIILLYLYKHWEDR